MKSKIAVTVLSIFIAVLSLSIGGCSNGKNESGAAQPSDSGSVPESSSAQEEPPAESAPESSPESVPEEPKGEPTVFVGLDGETILTTDITDIKDTDKTAAELTEDDLYASVYCSGFTYLMEPTGVSFDNYHNPEMFDGMKFIGEYPENTNKWRRVNVGDEICGLKVKKAHSIFTVNDRGKWVGSYFNESSRWNYDDDTPDPDFELEGEITLEGLLSVDSRNNYDPDGGYMEFTPTENKLPLRPVRRTETGFDPMYDRDWGLTPYNFLDYKVMSETYRLNLGKIQDATCDMSGVDIGDLAFVRVTVSHITPDTAFLEDIEVIEVLDHAEDSLGEAFNIGR